MIPFRVNRFTVMLLLALFFGLLLGYAYFEARNVIKGPVIVFEASSEVITVRESLVLVRGFAGNISELRMNERVIPTTENGAFEEAHLLAPGYNKIILSATDKLGRTATEILELVYVPKSVDMGEEE